MEKHTQNTVQINMLCQNKSIFKHVKTWHKKYLHIFQEPCSSEQYKPEVYNLRVCTENTSSISIDARTHNTM